jgi:hypothetical protein
MHGADGALVMPPAMPILTSEDIWALIDFIRAQNVGTGIDASGIVEHPVPAPGLDIWCGGNWRTLDSFRDHPVRLVAQATPATWHEIPDAVTIGLSPRLDGESASGARCRAGGRAAWSAYSVLSGIPESDLDGTAFLLDGEGLVRAVQPADAPEAAFRSLLGAIQATPATSPITRHHHH